MLGLEGREVSLTLVGDVAMRRLNLERRAVDRTTDVLSFPAAEVPDSPLLGDLVVCVPLALREARARRRPPRAELALYAVHGLLHLLGYDHARPAGLRRMAAAEQALLGETGLIGRAALQALSSGTKARAQALRHRRGRLS